MLSEEQYEKDAKVLKEAMAGWGTDEGPIIELMGNRTNADRQEIKKFYKTCWGKDLIEDLADELGGDLEDVILKLFMTPLEFDMHELYRSMKGGGTNEAALIEIIGSRSNARLTEIKDNYKEKYEIDLEEHVASEVSGDLKNLLISILQCNRSETTDVDEEKVNADVYDLYEAGEGTWGTEESAFNKIFALRSPAELRAIIAGYEDKAGKSLYDVVDSEFGGDMAKLLATVLHAQTNPTSFFAEKINNACKGWGTDDAGLVRALICRDEIDLPDIKALYSEKYGMSLYDQISDETGGDYKSILLAIAKD